MENNNKRSVGKVKHPDFGYGLIEFTKESTAIVRFSHGIEEVANSDLKQIISPNQLLESGTGQDFYKANLRGLANLIQSINDNWGIFSRTKIQLLPHQLWVCRKTTETWPARWLVADDVGLGKTIEAGLILLPLIERKLVSRFLVICPASLVEQWQERFYDLFDIRMTIYQRDNDNKKYNFWNANDQIIVSLQTLRTKNEQRRTNLFESDTWDLVIVDEAHHLNADEKQGPTLGYQVLHDLINGNKVNSMYFFTGTPHRGKDFGFFSLLHLLRPDLFDPKKEAVDQIHSLKQVLIRNNKQNVTNLNGEKLFQEPLVSSITYTYSDEENRFYELMTDFISTGKTYAGTLSGMVEVSGLPVYHHGRLPAGKWVAGFTLIED